MRENHALLPLSRPRTATESTDHLNPKQRSQRTTSPLPVPHRSSILKWWPETLGWFISVLIVAAIVVVLHAYNGVVTVRWQSQVPVTLNAFLSLLVTFLYMALMVPIPKCIAQLKWNHYAGGLPRPLSDIELFDEASRTVWGSAVLLVSRPNRLLAALGAFLTLAVAGVGPFVQQILSQEVVPHQLDGMIPTVPIFNWTSSYSGAKTMAATPTHDDIRVEGIHDQPIDSDAFDAGFYAGLIASGAREFPVAPSCAAANCTWEPYWTLVVESECRNLTDQFNSSWSLPNNLTVEFESTAATYNLFTKYPSVAFQDRGHLLADFFFTASDYKYNDTKTGLLPAASALECILQLRAKQVQAEYKNGIWSETQIGPSISANNLDARGCSPWRRLLAGSMFDLPAVSDPIGETFPNASGQDPLVAQWFAGGDPAKQETSTCNITIPTTANNTSSSPTDSIQNLIFPAIQLLTPTFRLFYLLGGDTGGIIGQAGGKTGGILNYLVSLIATNPQEQYLIDQTYNISFPERVENIAKGLTQSLRTSYFTERIAISGTAYRDTVVYRVEWVWVIVPGGLVLLTLVLLGLTVGDTVWKGLEKRTDSSLALMVLGCDEGVRRRMMELEGPHSPRRDLEKVMQGAKRLFARLGEGHVLTLAGEGGVSEKVGEGRVGSGGN